MEGLILDFKDYTEGTVYARIAARAIIRKNNRYLFVKGKDGDFKFPGGGMEDGETIRETLMREVSEETGYHVDEVTLSDKPKNFVHEMGKGEIDDKLIMDSYYYECNVVEDADYINDAEFETETGYNPVWMTLDEMIEGNNKCIGHELLRWVKRELIIAGRIRDEKSE